MQNVDYSNWAEYLHGLIKHFGRTGSQNLLECACGTGELTWRFEELGYQVTASDISPDMLRIAEEKCRRRGVRIPFVCQDMAQLSFTKPFDVIVSACDGVNYLLTERDLKRFFRSALSLLKPGGLLLFDVSSAYKLENVLGLNTFGEDDADVSYIWKNMYDPKSRLLEMKLTFFVRSAAGYERIDERQIQRAYRSEEIYGALTACGLTPIGAFEAFSCSEAAENSERIQWIARREYDAD